MPGFILSVVFALWTLLPGTVNVPEGKTTYEVRYKWGVVDTRVANGVFTVTPDKWEGQSAYRAVATVRATPFFRLFMADEYKLELFLSREGALPLHCFSPLRTKGKECEYTLIYHQDTRQLEAWTVSATESIQRNFSLDDGAMDIFTLFYYVQCLDASTLEQGKPLSLKVVMPRSEAPALLYYEGIDKEAVPGVVCHRYLLQFTGRGLMENRSGNTVHLWVSAGAGGKLQMLTVPLNNGVLMARIRK